MVSQGTLTPVDLYLNAPSPLPSPPRRPFKLSNPHFYFFLCLFTFLCISGSVNSWAWAPAVTTMATLSGFKDQKDLKFLLDCC